MLVKSKMSSRSSGLKPIVTKPMKVNPVGAKIFKKVPSKSKR